MATLINRPYRNITDFNPVIELLGQCWATGRFDRWLTLAEFRRICNPADTSWEKQVWVENEDKLLAFTLLGRSYGNLYFYLHPQLQDDELRRQIIAWALKQRQKAGQPSIRCQIRENDTVTLKFLEAEGFIRHELYTIRLIRPLNEPIPEPELPDGFSLRYGPGESRVEDYVAMHREAFGTTHMTVEERQVFMQDPAYNPDLDLIVVSPEGMFVAFCVGQIDQEENARNSTKEGWTDPIGTRPAFQRQGLARAALLATLQRLQGYGMDTALMGTGSWNTATLRLCQSAGFRPLYNIIWYTKETL